MMSLPSHKLSFLSEITAIRKRLDAVHRRLRFHAAERGISVEEVAPRIFDRGTQSPEQLGDVLAAFAKAHDPEVIEVERDKTPIRTVDFDSMRVSHGLK